MVHCSNIKQPPWTSPETCMAGNTWQTQLKHEHKEPRKCNGVNLFTFDLSHPFSFRLTSSYHNLTCLNLVQPTRSLFYFISNSGLLLEESITLNKWMTHVLMGILLIHTYYVTWSSPHVVWWIGKETEPGTCCRGFQTKKEPAKYLSHHHFQGWMVKA